ncbi:MAG: hypothetical protein ABII12_03295 [Planctomycetota bacterium]
MTDKQLFNQHRREFEQHGGALQSNAHNAMVQLRQARKHAYQMAVAYVTMLQSHTNDLRAWCHKQGCTGKDPFDQLLDKWFAPAQLVGVDHVELIQAVQDGMTQKQYLSKGVALWKSEKTKKKIAAAIANDAPLPSEPDETLPVEEQVKLWKVRAETAELQLSEIKKQVRELGNRNALLEREIKRLSRIINNPKLVAC